MPKFRKKPIVIEALQLRWDNWSKMRDFVSAGEPGKPKGINQVGDSIEMLIPTLEGPHLARENDWIIKGVKGELYPCKPDIFKEIYEPL